MQKNSTAGNLAKENSVKTINERLETLKTINTGISHTYLIIAETFGNERSVVADILHVKRMCVKD